MKRKQKKIKKGKTTRKGLRKREVKGSKDNRKGREREIIGKRIE